GEGAAAGSLPVVSDRRRLLKRETLSAEEHSPTAVDGPRRECKCGRTLAGVRGRKGGGSGEDGVTRGRQATAELATTTGGSGCSVSRRALRSSWRVSHACSRCPAHLRARRRCC